MGLGALVFLGTVVGAVGTEILHVKKPELIEKVEDAVKRFVD